jgi:hypothetical protein
MGLGRHARVFQSREASIHRKNIHGMQATCQKLTKIMMSYGIICPALADIWKTRRVMA